MGLKTSMIPTACRVCGATLPRKKGTGRFRLYCKPPAKCGAIAAREAKRQRLAAGIVAPVKLPAAPRESLASQRYREAVAALADAKGKAEAARRSVESADGVVEQCEVRLRDAESVLNRERFSAEDLPVKRKRKARKEVA